MPEPNPAQSSGEFYCGPFDPDELVRWAEAYGDPEQWAKKAQSLLAANERLREKLDLMHGLVSACATKIGDLGEPDKVRKIEERAKEIAGA